jgi:drug/metabolite transporter (DMT)-like permease
MRFFGFILGIIASSTYGLNPLFAMPIYAEGFSPDATLLMRYLPAVVILGVWMLIRRISFKLSLPELAVVVVGGMLFGGSSLLLYQSYLLMDTGIASTLLFVYPIMTTVLMMICFHEKLKFITVAALTLALVGIAMLCKKSDGSAISVLGVILTMLSALTYAIYLVMNNMNIIKKMRSEKLTFYVLAFGASLFLVRLACTGWTFGNFTPKVMLCATLMALLPTVISLVCITMAIHYIGATAAAILGALEPLTAMSIGVLVFHEEFTLRIAIGIVLILTAVILVVLKKA